MSIMNDKIMLFVKFGEEKYIRRLFNGRIYFSNAVKFRRIEKKNGLKGQGDAFEAILQLKNGYVYSTGVSLVNNLNVVVSPMVQKLDLSLYHLVVIGVCQVMPMFKYGLMKSKEFRTACSSFFINSVFYPFNKSFH